MPITKFKDKDSAIPFDDLIIELFECRDDKMKLEAHYEYIIKNKYDYCLVHLLTLTSCCLGYLQKLKIWR